MTESSLYRRQFLNRRGHHAGAYVLAECKLARWQERLELEAFVTISDCSRVVTLDLGGATRTEISNALFKARVLRDILVEVTASLEALAQEISEA